MKIAIYSQNTQDLDCLKGFTNHPLATTENAQHFTNIEAIFIPVQSSKNPARARKQASTYNNAIPHIIPWDDKTPFIALLIGFDASLCERLLSYASHVYVLDDKATAIDLTHDKLSIISPPIRFGAIIDRLRAKDLAYRQERPLVLHGGLAINLYQRRILNTDTRLTEKECDMLRYIATSPTPVSRQDLLAHVWKYARDTDTHTVETHIYRLRQKIEDNPNTPKRLITLDNGYQLTRETTAT